MPDSLQELPPVSDLKILAFFLLIIAVAGQVFLLFIFPTSTYAPGEGQVISFPAVAFQICAMLSAVGLEIVGTLLLVTLHLSKILTSSSAAAPMPPVK